MSQPVIEIKNLSKSYFIGHESKATPGTLTLRDSLATVLKKPAEFVTGHKLKKEKFLALDRIDSSIEKGDVVGLIGKNGSGKSTLLKILSRIVEPTSGEIIMRGKSASLLEVGTGFHPELTGRENIYFNGSILGMKKKEIDSKFDEIVEFSGVEKFLDTPVKFYSSGMYVRLAFAVAAHLEPDILIVDEVLAVGDAEFQKKSLGKMKSVTQNGQRTVIFVSHNMDAIQSICNKCVWLSNGKIVRAGNTSEVVDSYIKSATIESTLKASERLDRQGNGQVVCDTFDVKNNIKKSKEFTIDLNLKNMTRQSFNKAKLSIDVYDQSGIHLSNIYNNTIDFPIDYEPGDNRFEITVSDVNLVPGTYFFNIFVASDAYNTTLFDAVDSIAAIKVPHYDYYNVGNPPDFKGRYIYLEYGIKRS